MTMGVLIDCDWTDDLHSRQPMDFEVSLRNPSQLTLSDGAPERC